MIHEQETGEQAAGDRTDHIGEVKLPNSSANAAIGRYRQMRDYRKERRPKRGHQDHQRQRHPRGQGSWNQSHTRRAEQGSHRGNYEQQSRDKPSVRPRKIGQSRQRPSGESAEGNSGEEEGQEVREIARRAA